MAILSTTILQVQGMAAARQQDLDTSQSLIGEDLMVLQVHRTSWLESTDIGPGRARGGGRSHHKEATG